MESPRTKMKLSYSAVWDDTAALLRAHGSLIAALAGVFIFLPALLLRQFAVSPPMEGAPGDAVHAFAASVAYLSLNWPFLLLVRLADVVGSAAILQLLLGPRGTSVAGAIRAGFLLMPFYFAAYFISNLAMALGLIFFVIPAVYLVGRLALVGPVVVGEARWNPAAAIARSWSLTEGQGWAVAGLVLLVGIGAVIVMAVVVTLSGIIFVLLAGKSFGTFLSGIVASAAGAAMSVLFLTLYAALYRALAGSRSAAVFE